MHALLSALHDEEDCSFECSSMLIGALSRGMRAHHLLEPRPAPPFNGFSVAALFEGCRSFREPRWYTGKGGRVPHQCSLFARLSPLLAEVLGTVDGLEWESFFRAQ